MCDDEYMPSASDESECDGINYEPDRGPGYDGLDGNYWTCPPGRRPRPSYPAESDSSDSSWASPCPMDDAPPPLGDPFCCRCGGPSLDGNVCGFCNDDDGGMGPPPPPPPRPIPSAVAAEQDAIDKCYKDAEDKYWENVKVCKDRFAANAAAIQQKWKECEEKMKKEQTDLDAKYASDALCKFKIVRKDAACDEPPCPEYEIPDPDPPTNPGYQPVFEDNCPKCNQGRFGGTYCTTPGCCNFPGADPEPVDVLVPRPEYPHPLLGGKIPGYPIPGYGWECVRPYSREPGSGGKREKLKSCVYKFGGSHTHPDSCIFSCFI